MALAASVPARADTAAPDRLAQHPRRFRTAILLAALVAVTVWWGFGLPYSVFIWLLDDVQLWWTKFCYAWEVPVAGLLGPVLVPYLWWRRVERRWTRAFAGPEVDQVEAEALEAGILDYPIRVAWVFLATSVVGYAIGAVQLWVFAELPVPQLVNVCLLGIVTGLVGGLFAFLYLEQLLAPLLRDLGLVRATAPPCGRHVTIRTKVFACSLVLIVCTVPLFGTLFWNEAARVLEQEFGRQLLTQTHAAALGSVGSLESEAAPGRAWDPRAAGLELGASGSALVTTAAGRVVIPAAGGPRHLDELGLRSTAVRTILDTSAGHFIDRRGATRVVAFASVGEGGQRLVALVPRPEVDHRLGAGLRKAAVVFAMTLFLALSGSFLFSQRLARPIGILTERVEQTARAPGELAAPVPVRTNDEVGTLAVAFNEMAVRLSEAHGALRRYSTELEARIAEATRRIATLYDVNRTITSTLENEDLLQLAAEQIQAALRLRDLVLLRYSPTLDGVVDAYAMPGGRLAVDETMDLSRLCAQSHEPAVRAHGVLAPLLTRDLAGALGGPQVMLLPLLYKGLLVGAILASVESQGDAPDLELAAALAGQVAVALANAGLYERVRQHDHELRELSEKQAQVQEETLRTVSRDLHDGIGQALTAIKIDLGLLQREEGVPAATVERLRAIQAQVGESMQEVRRISQLLRPSILDDLGLVPSLRALVEATSSRTDLTVSLTAADVDGRLPPAIEVMLYRVTQEALTNMVKHARARHGAVELTIGPRRVRLTIRDDGVGFDVDRFRRTRSAGGVGLLGMRERVAYHRGWMDIRSHPGTGVEIVMSLPVGPGAEAGEEPEGA